MRLREFCFNDEEIFVPRTDDDIIETHPIEIYDPGPDEGGISDD